MRRLGIFNKASCLLATLFSSISVIFGSWVIINNDTSADVTIEKTEAKAICYNKNTNAVYTSLKTALDRATSNQEIIVYIGANITCTDTITIKQGVTLTIPFVGKAYDSSKTGNNINDTPLYKISSVDDRAKYGNVLGDENSSRIKTYRSAVINMRNGADIINNGTLNLGGACSTNGNNGYYSEINLGQNSSIECANGSIFECYGYVKESVDDFYNSLNDENNYDNSKDSSRYINLESGSKMITQLAMYDAQSAGNLTNLINAKQCPFWEWDFPCLQTYVKINNGATISAMALLIGPNNMGINKEVVVFSNNTATQSMFYLTDGFIGLEYLTDDPQYSSRKFNARHTNFYINGTTSVGYIYAKEGVAGVAGANIELDTRKSFLPVSCRTNIIVASNHSLVTDKKIKFLAGSKLYVQQNATFTINNEIIFHKKDSIVLNSGVGVYYRIDSNTSINDAKLVCDGVINFNSDGNSNGAIGAFIEHKNQEGTAIVDMSTITDDSKLTVKETEGPNDSIVIITSTGSFIDGEAQFLKQNKYTSQFSTGNYYWNGNHLSTYVVNVVIEDSTENSVVLYTLQYADDTQGSNITDSELINATAAGTTSIPRNKYLKIDLIRGNSVTVKNSNGDVISTSSDYILVNQNLIINIEPSETYTLDFTIEKDSDNVQWNGTGHFTFEIWESKTSNGTFTKVYDGKYNGTKYICKDSYFYIKRPFDSDTLYNYFKNSNAEITKTPDVGDKPNWNVKSKKQSPTYYADANYAFKTYWTYTGGCFAKETPILMSDGTYKNIENIVYGDEIMTWNFFAGQYESQKVAIIVDHGEEVYKVLNLKFSNLSTLSIIADHGLFDYDLNKFVYIDVGNYKEYLNHRFAIYENDNTNLVTLVGASICEKKTHAYSITSAFNYNAIAGDLLTAPPPGEFYNWINMSDKMRYDVDEFNADIEKYGLYDYSVFEPYGISYETFVAFNGQYLKIPVEKGIFSFDYIIELFNQYKDWINE